MKFFKVVFYFKFKSRLVVIIIFKFLLGVNKLMKVNVFFNRVEIIL